MKQHNHVERLREIFNSTIDSGLDYSDSLENIDYYSLLCKATAENKLYKMFSCNLCMFNYKYFGEDSILILIAIPVNLNVETTNDTKHVSERMMDILKVLEDCFITIDYMNSKDVKEDKFIYMVMVKKIKN